MLISLLRLYARLPLPLIHLLGVAVGWLMYLGSPKYARHMCGQIKLAPATLRGVRDLLQFLNRCQSIGILPDQVPSGVQPPVTSAS